MSLLFQCRGRPGTGHLKASKSKRLIIDEGKNQIRQVTAQVNANKRSCLIWQLNWRNENPSLYHSEWTCPAADISKFIQFCKSAANLWKITTHYASHQVSHGQKVPFSVLGIINDTLWQNTRGRSCHAVRFDPEKKKPQDLKAHAHNSHWHKSHIQITNNAYMQPHKLSLHGGCGCLTHILQKTPSNIDNIIKSLIKVCKHQLFFIAN